MSLLTVPLYETLLVRALFGRIFCGQKASTWPASCRSSENANPMLYQPREIGGRHMKAKPDLDISGPMKFRIRCAVASGLRHRVYPWTTVDNGSGGAFATSRPSYPS